MAHPAAILYPVFPRWVAADIKNANLGHMFPSTLYARKPGEATLAILLSISQDTVGAVPAPYVQRPRSFDLQL